MNIEVRYYSRTGNTKKVADAIAKAVGVEAKDCGSAITEQVDLLFLGGAVYMAGIDKTIREYIERLDPKKVKKVVLFGTSAIVKSPGKEMEKLLRQKNIPVANECFYCRGAFTVMHLGHPNAEDMNRAAEFALASKKKLG